MEAVIIRQVMLAGALLGSLLQPAAIRPLDNEYVRVTRNGGPCAAALPSECGERVLIALGPITFQQLGQPRHLERGEIAVFRWHESYVPPATGEYLEVSIRQDRPRVQAPPVPMQPGNNVLLYDGETFFVFEERLAPGETRARHSHSERVVVVLNDTRLQQRPDGQPEVLSTEVAGEVRFDPPVTHIVKTIGDRPLRNIVIELKP